MFDEYKQLAKLLLLFIALPLSVGFMLLALWMLSFPLNYIVAFLPLYIVISIALIEREKVIKRTEGCDVLMKGLEVGEERRQEAIRYMRELKKKAEREQGGSGEYDEC